MELPAAGATMIAGLALPWTLITSGPPGDELATVIVSVRWPAASGAKVTVKEQEAWWTSTADGQLPVPPAKSEILLPPSANVEMSSSPAPVLAITTVMGALVVPWVTVGNTSGLGPAVATGVGGVTSCPV